MESLGTLSPRYPHATCRTQLGGWLVSIDTETGWKIRSFPGPPSLLSLPFHVQIFLSFCED